MCVLRPQLSKHTNIRQHKPPQMHLPSSTTLQWMLAAETAVTLAAETAAHAPVQVACYPCSVDAAEAGADEARQKRKCNAERARDVTGVGAGHYRAVGAGDYRADCHCSVAARPNTDRRHDANFFVSTSALEGLCSYRDQAQPECGFPVDVTLQGECPVPRAKRGVHALDTNLQHPFCERLGKYHREHMASPVRQNLSRARPPASLPSQVRLQLRTETPMTSPRCPLP